MSGCRSNSNQARICVLGFSANRVWLVNHLYIFLYYFVLHYYKACAFSIPTINTTRLCVLLWLIGLRRRSLGSEVRETQIRSPDQDFFILINIQCRTGPCYLPSLSQSSQSLGIEEWMCRERGVGCAKTLKDDFGTDYNNSTEMHQHHLYID